jgi:hypothetical protein
LKESAKMPKAFLMTTDLGLVFDTNLSIDEDYEASDFHSIDLWSRHEPRPPGTGRLVYSWRYRSPRFDAYDYFPDTGSIAIVSDRLKFVFEQICSAGEVGFYPCEIRFKDITKEVWAAYPLTIKLLVDRQQSEIEWYVPDLQPKELIVKTPPRLFFRMIALATSTFADGGNRGVMSLFLKSSKPVSRTSIPTV